MLAVSFVGVAEILLSGEMVWQADLPDTVADHAFVHGGVQVTLDDGTEAFFDPAAERSA